MKCCICKEEIDKQIFPKSNTVWKKGHNAQPIKDGRCCSNCNNTVVIPERFKRLKEREAVK